MDNLDELLTEMDNDLAQLRSRESELLEIEDKARRERDDLRIRVAEIGKLKEGLLRWAGRPQEIPQTPSLGLATPASIPTGTIAEMAYAILQSHGGRMKVQAILDELVRLKKLKGVRGDYGTLYGTLTRDSRRFRLVDKGTFGLVGQPSAQGVLIPPQFG